MIGIKIGGSLIDYAREVLDILKNKDVAIIPGGGIFADFIRQTQKELDFSDEASHNMALLAMEQYGYYLHEISGIPTKYEIDNSPGPYIFLPYRFIEGTDELDHSWQTTSDTIGMYISYRLGVNKYIILTDVDGVYFNVRLMEEIDTDLLEQMVTSCVDEALPKYYEKFYVDTWIINGKKFERVENIFKDKFKGTRIIL